MKYIDIVKTASIKSDSVMWAQVKEVSDLIDQLWKSHPDMAQRFMMKAYGTLHGEHFNEQLAKEFVNAMYHYNNREEKVTGEVVPVEEAESILEPTDREKMRWDAYVAANTMMHDMARADMDRRVILEAARVFWFADDDFDGNNKVFWYFANK